MSWEIKRIKDVALVTAGQSPEGKYYNIVGNGMPFFQGKKEFTEKFMGEAKVWTTKITKMAEEGDVLMSVRAPVGPVNFATQKCCIGRGLASIRVTENFDKDFLFLFFQYIENELTGNSGAVFNSINKSQIENISIPLPSISEQQQIVEKLDTAFDLIDRAKANIEKNIQNAKELFQSKLFSIFNVGEKHYQYSPKMFEDICVLQRGFDLPTRLREPGTYPLVSSNGITDNISQFKVNGPGVTTGRSGTIGKVHFIEDKFWPLNTSLYIKDFKKNNEKYIFYFLQSVDLNNYASGAGVPTLNRNFIHSEMFKIIDNQSAQKKIVVLLDQLHAKSELLQQKYQKKLANLEELKKSILAKAFKSELI